MTALPIVERELRVASRRPATYRLRFFLALGVFILWYLLVTFGPSAVPVARGQMVFMSLGTLAFAFCLLSGVFLTADCLSQEKREGTIGLLFLTELKGYDVVLGKLMATSIHAFYGLGAILPLLTYSMLVGGVTIGEFWRIAMTLIATLFLSLSTGVLISARSRDTRQAMGGTLLALVGLAGLPGVAWSLVFHSGFWRFIEWPSPVYLFNRAFDTSFQTPGGAFQFCASFLTILFLAAGMLALAGRYLSRVWQEKGESEPVLQESRSRWYGFLGPAFRSGRVLSGNPYHWLASRDLRPTYKVRAFLACFFLIWFCFVAGCFSSSPGIRIICLNATALLAYGLHHGLKWLIAFEASRRLSEDRHSGALELLLVSPISIEEIIAGQRQALGELFRGPMLLAIFTNALLMFVTIHVFPGMLAPPQILLLCEIYVGGAILMLVDFHALTWVGMWMALQTRRHTRAILATLARVMFVPWLAIFFIVLLTIGGGGLSMGTALGLSMFWFALAAVLEHAFASRAKIGLVEAFRQISAAPETPAPNPLFMPQPMEATSATSGAGAQ